MNKIVNGVANDFEYDFSIFPPNVEKIIITKDNYKRLFNNLQEENIIYKEIIDKAISMLELSGGREKISKDFVNIGRKRYDEIIKVLKGE